MGLKNLPNEVLCEILLHIEPADLENFAQICRHVSLIAQPFLVEHRRLIQKYAESDIRDEELAFIFGSAEGTATNSRIGNYVHHLRSDNELTTSLVTSLERLPNLRSFSMDESHTCLVTWRDMLGTYDELRKPFSKLKRLRVRSSGYQGVPLGFVQDLSLFPSMRELIVDNSGDIGDEGIIKPVQSTISRLELWHCQIRAEELNELLKGFSQLETLIYSGNRGYTDRDNSTVAYPVPAGLQSAKDKLKNMLWIAPGKPKCFLGDLRSFEAMEDLKTEIEFLRISDNDTTPQLPTSLKFLKIVHQTTQSGAAYVDLINDIAAWKSTSGSQLKEILLTDFGYGHMEHNADLKRHVPKLINLCKGAGIDLLIEGTIPIEEEVDV